MIFEYMIDKNPSYINTPKNKPFRVNIAGGVTPINKFYTTASNARRAVKIMSGKDYGHRVYDFTKNIKD